jgi:hypothetical protein
MGYGTGHAGMWDNPLCRVRILPYLFRYLVWGREVPAWGTELAPQNALRNRPVWIVTGSDL